MKRTVYIETTIPSFYYETRDEAVFAAMRQWTREWWDAERSAYRCFTSDAVINEVESGDHPEKQRKLTLLGSLDLLEIQMDLEEIVEVYLANFLMPKDELGDALVSQNGFSADLELSASGECKQAGPYPAHQRAPENFHAELVTPYELIGDSYENRDD